MQHASDAMGHMDSNPAKCVKITWALIIVLCCINVIVSITVAAHNNVGSNGSSGAAFAAVWTLFILVAYCIAGSFIIQRYHSPLAVGVFMGMSTMMSQLMLVLFGVFIALAHDSGGNSKSSDQAFAAFAFFLFLLLGIFSMVLARYRTTLMQTADDATKTDNVGGWNSTNPPAAEMDAAAAAPAPNQGSAL